MPSSEALPRIGGIATMPSRTHTFARVLASILPQLDRLFVFLDKSAVIPAAFLGHPKIEPLTPARFGDLRSGGKVLGAALQTGPCIYFCFDDDILYPPTYVELLSVALQRHFMRAIVGLHGVYFQPPHRSYRDNRGIHYFGARLDVDVCVDALGTGTIAFHSGNFRVDPRRWPETNMDDLMVAIEAVKQEVSRICVRRPQDFLQPLDAEQPDSIARRLLTDDRRETEVMRAALEAHPHAWQRCTPGRMSPAA